MQPNNFLAIKQANVAHQQVVQNVESPNLQNANTSNEQGSTPAALPPVVERTGSLRATALRNKPWLRSTGPKTPTGKTRSKLNATKHGERSAKSRAVWRELNAALRAISHYDRQQASAIDGLASAGPDTPDGAWVLRIAQELRVSDLSQELLLARFADPAHRRQ